MSARIRRMYTSKGLPPPDGKGVHTERFHAMATAIMKGGKGRVRKEVAYATAMKRLGRDKAVKKSHWK